MDAHYTFLFLSTCVNWYTFFCPPGQGSLVSVLHICEISYIQVLPISEVILFSSRMEKKYCLQNHVKKKVDVKHSPFLFQLMSSFKTMQPYKSSFYWYLLHDMTEEGRYMWHGNERREITALLKDRYIDEMEEGGMGSICRSRALEGQRTIFDQYFLELSLLAVSIHLLTWSISHLYWFCPLCLKHTQLFLDMKNNFLWSWSIIGWISDWLDS